MAEDALEQEYLVLDAKATYLLARFHAMIVPGGATIQERGDFTKWEHESWLRTSVQIENVILAVDEWQDRERRKPLIKKLQRIQGQLDGLSRHYKQWKDAQEWIGGLFALAPRPPPS